MQVISFSISLVIMTSGINVIAQQDSCTLYEQAGLISLFDYNTIYHTLKYTEEYYELDDEYLVSENLESVYREFLKSACDIFTEEDIARLKELYQKYQIDNMDDMNNALNVISEHPDNFIDPFLEKLFQNDPDYIDIIEKLKIYFQSVMHLVERSVMEQKLASSGYATNPGIAEYYLDNHEEAIDYFKKLPAEELQSSWLDLYYLGLSQRAVSQFDEALENLQRAQVLAPEKSELNYNLADLCYYVFGDVSTASVYLGKALQLNPDHYYSRLLKGKILIINNEIAEAKKIFTRLIEEQPELIDAYNERGMIFGLEYNAAAALEDYSSAYQIDSLDMNAIKGKSSTLFGLQQYEEGYALLQNALLSYPDDKSIYGLIGEYYLATEDYDSCVICYEFADTDPSNIYIQNNLGYCLMKSGAHEKAAGIFMRIIAECESDESMKMMVAYGHNNLGYCLYKTGELNDALDHIETSLALEPNNACALIHKVIVEDALGRSGGHCENLNRASKLPNLVYCGQDMKKLLENYCRD